MMNLLSDDEDVFKHPIVPEPPFDNPFEEDWLDEPDDGYDEDDIEDDE